MRRASAGAVGALLLLAITGPAAAIEDVTQRVELPEIGLEASFPAGWNVQALMQPRESWFDVSATDSTPVYAWTAMFAIGDEGRWCGIDRYEDFPWTFDEHAAFLERWHVSASLYGRSGGYEAVELASGPAYRIDVNDEIKERTSTLYLLEQGSDHILLTCADILGSTEDWLPVAESIALGSRSADAGDIIAARLDEIHAD